MDTVTLIKDLCKEKRIAISKLEKDCGFSNGYIRGLRRGVLPNDRAQIIANYLGVSIEYLTTGEEKDQGTYYINEETAEMAQAIFESKELKMLFDVQRDMSAADLLALHNMALALKRKERGEIDR